MKQLPPGAWACSKCGKTHWRSHRYCEECHAEYMREWRKTHRLDDEQRRRANARAYANVYLRRGKLERKPCRRCGEPNAQMHHHDYDKPLEVDWLCRSCHLLEHSTAA